jgi:hypothetical protein
MAKILSQLSVLIEDATISVTKNKLSIAFSQEVESSSGEHDCCWDFDAEIAKQGRGFKLVFAEISDARNKTANEIVRHILNMPSAKAALKYLKKEQKKLPDDTTLSQDLLDLDLRFSVYVEQPDPEYRYLGVIPEDDDDDEDEDE